MSEREPTRDELQAMAYVDGELDGADRERFEERLAKEPTLLREVAELDKLGVLARQETPVEPKDFEWRRLELETLHGGGIPLGLWMSATGALGIIAWIFYSLLTSAMAIVPKTFYGLLLAGLTIVFLLVFRARLRTRPFDPYTEVER